MVDSSTPSQRRYPNMIGAGLIVGILFGLAVGGALDNFGLWLPILGGLGLVVGLLLHAGRGHDVP
jgi:hypothetical protein